MKKPSVQSGANNAKKNAHNKSRENTIDALGSRGARVARAKDFIKLYELVDLLAKRGVKGEGKAELS